MLPSRTIEEHAALGDGRTAALVASDGTVDWLCLPDLNAAPVFSRLLDSVQGGAFTLAPAEGGEAQRRYVPGTNVLQTYWATPYGAVRVTDALDGGPGRDSAQRPARLVRRVEGVEGEVRMEWQVSLRFGDGDRRPAHIAADATGMIVQNDGLRVRVTGLAGCEPDDPLRGQVTLRAGECHVLTVSVADTGAHQPAVDIPAIEAAWRAWSAKLSYEGRWRSQVQRSALALRLLVHEPTGAMAAAATFGLPEQPTGPRNYDYRYCWLRDSSFVVDAFGSVGDRASSEAYLRWMTKALARTTPVLQPFYRLDGGTDAPQRDTDLAGYGGAQPVRVGNQASQQRQLGSCGDVLQSCALLVEHGGRLPRGLPELLTAAVNHLVGVWREPDAGIWEIAPVRQHTWSKMACWTALTRAADLADQGHLRGDTQSWRAEAEQVKDHIESRHWSDSRCSYTAVAGEDDLDAAVLLGVIFGYEPANPSRWKSTIAALDADLGEGPFLYRTTELRGNEQLFLPCAFWRAHALARLGEIERAQDALDRLTGAANDVGLFSEEIDTDGRMWGNFPQALTHAAFINAAVTCDRQRRRRRL